MTENLDGGVAASIDATYAIRQPAEYCGHELTGLVHTDRWTECVLRPGHQGSHASHEGARWIERPADGYCPHCGRGDAGPTADAYEQLRQRARQDAAASRESERQLQQQIDVQAKEIDRLRNAHRHEEELSADLRARLKATSDACSDATTLLYRIGELHTTELSNEFGATECRTCRDPWPCDTATILAALEPPKETPNA